MRRLLHAVLYLGAIILAVIAYRSFRPASVSHGPAAVSGAVDVYYLEGATHAQAKAVADAYAKQAKGERASLQIKKNVGQYQLRFVIRKEFHNDESSQRSLEIFAARCSRDCFNSVPVEVHVCDEHFRTVNVLPPRGDLRFGVVNAPIEVFFGDKMDQASAELLAKHFADLKVENAMTLKLAKREEVFEVYLVIQVGKLNDPGILEGFRTEQKLIAERVFNGEPVELHLCDPQLRVVRVIEP